MPKYLVEISTKDWIAPTKSIKVICYKEVVADNILKAKHKAFNEFENDLQYKPKVRKDFTALGLTTRDIAADDAVEI